MGSASSLTDELSRAREAVGLAATQPDRARALADAVLREAPGGLTAAEAERALGLVARKRQDVSAAVAHLTRAIRYAERAGAAGTAAEVRVSLALALAFQGRVGTALAELDRAAAVLRGAQLARVQLQRAAVWQLQGQVDAAMAAYDEALPLLDRAGDRNALAVLHNNRGLVRSRRGLLVGAEADLRRAVELHRELGQDGEAAEAAQNVGLIAARRGDVVAALAAFDDVDRHRGPAGTDDAVGLLDRAEALLAARLLEEAGATGRRALVELERLQLHAYLAEARLLLAQVALLEGRPAEARTLALEAAAAFGRQRRPAYRTWAAAVAARAGWEAGDRSPELAAASGRLARQLESAGWTMAGLDARLVAGQVALALDRVAAGRRHLVPLAERRRKDPAEVRSRVFHARALLHLAAGDPRRAQAALRAGMTAVERHRAAMGGTELRVGASAHAADLARLGVRLAVAAGDPWPVLDWAERWRAGSLGLRPVRPPAEAELAAALAELRQVVLAQQEDPASVALLRRQSVVERTVQRLARQGRVADPYRAARPGAAQMNRALGERALVEYVESGDQLYAVVVAGRRHTLHPLGPVEPVSRSATMVRFWLRRLLSGFGSLSSAAGRQLSAEAARLDALLVAPLAARLAGRELVVVPTGAAHAVPWSLLPTCAGRSVSVTPSAAWWVQAAQRAAAGPAARPGRVVLVAGPDLVGGVAEVAELGRLYPGALTLAGPDATVEAVLAAMDGADLVHVAAHGRFRTDQPLMSALQLADGPLTVYDLERLDRAPGLIVLASCTAGWSEIRPGDELIGLSAAVLALGTATVLAPLLPVPDTTTRPVVLAVHRALADGAGPSAALVAAGSTGTPDPAAAGGIGRLTAAAFLCLGAG